MYNITVDGENRARGCANLDIPLEELLAKPMTEQVHLILMMMLMGTMVMMIGRMAEMGTRMMVLMLICRRWFIVTRIFIHQMGRPPVR